MNLTVIVGTLMAALILTMGSARAVEVKLRYNHPTSGYSAAYSMDQPAGTFYLGLYNMSVDVQPFTGMADQSFNALCIDPFQDEPGTWTSYQAVAFSTFSANPNYSNVRKLYDNAYADLVNLANPGGLTKPQYATAFHLALWEIWAGNYDLEVNPVNVLGGVNDPVELKARDFLNALGGWSVTNAYDPGRMVAFMNPAQQDFLAIGVAAVPTGLPVPEADSYALLALGMGLAGLLSRRRAG